MEFTWNLTTGAASTVTTGTVTGFQFLTGDADISDLPPVIPPPLHGDYNGDGSVDAADYVVWRKNDGSLEGYNIWRAHFGQTAVGGAALPSAEPLSAAVPEPATFVMLLMGMLAFMRQHPGLHLRALSAYLRGLGAVMAVALSSIAADSLFAADSTSTWTNATSGEWDNAANWTPNSFFPNNGNGGFATHDAVIDAVGSNYTVTLDTNITVEDLTLNSANATLNHTTGDFTATSGIDLVAGTYSLNGGNISNTTINLLGGSFSVTSNNNNRLSNNALLVGDLNLSLPGGRVRLQSGATFSGDAHVDSSGASGLFIEYSATLDDKTINLNGPDARVTIEGNNILTLGPDLVLRGRGLVGNQAFLFGTNGLVNQGTIRADLAAQTLTLSSSLDSFTNQGAVEASNGGFLVIDSATAMGITNVSGNTLTGGTWRAAANGSRIDIDAAQIQTNDADIILDGAGSLVRSRTFNAASFVNLEATLSSNAAGGALRVLGGRDYIATAAGSFVNSGDLEIGGGTFSAPLLSNTATGEIFGRGTIQNTILNSGIVRAAGGTLVVNGAGIDGQSGTIQIDPGAALDLSGATADADADFLVHNGAGLNLGGNDVLVGMDYTNANSGVGNAFNPRANVTGAGQINANPAVTQTLGGNVTNGATTTATMAFGNVHVGSSTMLDYQINNVGVAGPSIRGAIQTTVDGANVTDSRLTGAGVTASNFAPITVGSDSGNRDVTFNATSAGPLTGQRIRIVNNFDNVAEQTLEFTGAAYRLANPTAHTPEPVNFGNRHVGDPAPSQTLSITNNVPADGFSESLNASIGSPTGGVTTNGGSFTAVAPGATNNSSLSVGIDTAAAGNKSGTAAIALTPDGAGTSGLGLTPLASQTVNVTGSVFRLASPSAHTPAPVNFGIVHVGDVLQQPLSITNNVPNDGFSERLNASIGSPTSAATTNGGSFTALLPAVTNNSNLVVGINTATAGAKAGTATITLTSNGGATSGLPNTPLPSQTVDVTAQVNNFAVANVTKLGGDGMFSMNAANEFTLDLGLTAFGDANPLAELGVVNTAAAPADSLAGDFTLAAPDFSLAGFGAFSGVAAGAMHAGLTVELDSSVVGAFTGLITLQPRSTNPRPFSMDLASITIRLVGEVRLLGDYNENGTVDAADYVVWRKTLGQMGALLAADGNDNGEIDDGDYGVWRAHFGQTAGTGSAPSSTSHFAVPEPSAAVMLLMGLLVKFCRRRAVVS